MLSLFDVASARPELLPTNVFLNPVVKTLPADEPINVLSVPDVTEPPELKPTAVLLESSFELKF